MSEPLPSPQYPPKPLGGPVAVDIGVQETNDGTAMSGAQWLLLVAVLAMTAVYAAQVVAAAWLSRAGLPAIPGAARLAPRAR